jgi:hypothetical protein
MIRRITMIVLTLMLLTSADTAADEVRDALTAAKAIMATLAGKNYQRLWDEQTSNWLKERNGNSKDYFFANITMTRGMFGTLKSSKVVDVVFHTNDPESGFNGKIYTVNFFNSYEAGNFYERIVVIEENGRFLMSGFVPMVRAP